MLWSMQASRDFAGEAARLSAVLQQREQDLRYTGDFLPTAKKLARLCHNSQAPPAIQIIAPLKSC